MAKEVETRRYITGIFDRNIICTVTKEVDVDGAVADIKYDVAAVDECGIIVNGTQLTTRSHKKANRHFLSLADRFSGTKRVE